MNVRELLAAQYDVVAAWQLIAADWTRAMVDHRVSEHGWRVVHRGVYALTNAELTRHQLWMAATLTAPGSVLSHASAAACWGFRPWQSRFETITRPGSGGPKRIGSVLVARSRRLAGDFAGDVTRHQGLEITTPARVLIDLASGLDDRAVGRELASCASWRPATRASRTSGRGPTRRAARSSCFTTPAGSSLWSTPGSRAKRPTSAGRSDGSSS